jgi:hypothetical protein
VGQHRSASASRLLGLDGFEVLAAEVVGGEWRLAVQTTAEPVGCAGCGVRAEAHGRRTVRARDLPAGGRPVVLAWRKRIWRCTEPACGVRTWTEQVAAIRPRAVLTERARAEACRRVGKDAHAVAAVARDLGVGWATVMGAVSDHGRLATRCVMSAPSPVANPRRPTTPRSKGRRPCWRRQGSAPTSTPTCRSCHHPSTTCSAGRSEKGSPTSYATAKPRPARLRPSDRRGGSGWTS